MKGTPFKYKVVSSDGTSCSRHRYRQSAANKARRLTRGTGTAHKVEKITPPEEPPAVPIDPEMPQKMEVPVTQITFLGQAILAEDAMRRALEILTPNRVSVMALEEFDARRNLAIAGLKRALGIAD